ncbi:MAG: glycosyltransferase, partial [Gammaproteobacteria bacterium]|nr:glycosyltransferase [Gammaproteobacteria bacterium]
MKLNFHLPINTTSFGQTSCLIARTLFDKIKNGELSDDDYSIAPLGNVDISTQNLPEDFQKWLQNKINKHLSSHRATTPTFKLWHLNGALDRLSEKQTLLSFYELDQPTAEEINAVKNNNTLFSSNYTISNFKSLGAQSKFLPLAFDSYNFFKTDKTYSPGRIVFNLCGKLEKRKHHSKIIQAWVKKFKNDHRVHLQCAIYNPFLKPEDNNAVLNNILNGQKPFNVSFLPFMGKNSIYNDFLNSANIIIGCSGGEGWGLPEFTSLCLGKHAVIMNAHAYQEWAEEKNCVLLNPSGKIPAYDGMFFHQGAPFNQGDIFNFDEEEFISKCETAIAKYQASPNNEEGEKLKTKFTKENLLTKIIEYAS